MALHIGGSKMTFSLAGLTRHAAATLRFAKHGLMASVVMVAIAQPANAAEEIDLTIASSHPLALPWIRLMKEYFQPEVNKRLAEQGGEYTINWLEAYGGTLYKPNASLTSIGDGIADIGWVFSTLEGSRLPLAQVGNYTPGATGDPLIVMDAINEMNDSIPALKKEWERNNVVFLSSTAMDTLHLFTNFPVTSLEDLKGRKIGGAGSIGSVVAGAGAIPINTPAPAMYNNISTGLMDGAVTITSVVLGTKIYEITPYLVKVDLGTFSAGALAFNKDRWEELPKSVQEVIKEVSRDYSRTFGKNTNASIDKWFSIIQKNNPDSQVIQFPEEARRDWILNMPNVALEWANVAAEKNLPAANILKTYMNELRERGVTPTRDWDEDL